MANSEEQLRRAGVELVAYAGEKEHLGVLVSLMERDLSEPYSVFTYRYFLSQWPDLAFLARDVGTSEFVGGIICKCGEHRRTGTTRGYIAMLAVDNKARKRGIGSVLVRAAIEAMKARLAPQKLNEVTLETEANNTAALALYGGLGFLKDQRLLRYYCNGGDAFQLLLPLC